MRVSDGFRSLVPVGSVEENLRWRYWVLSQCEGDVGRQRSVLEMCRRDPVFWLGTFCWTYNPKKGTPRLPFVPWGCQSSAFSELCRSANEEDALVEKSREMGASWLCMYLVLWLWLFHAYTASLVASRKEDLVDRPGDPDSLFWKLDFALRREHMPSWMRPRYDRAMLRFENHDIGSVIHGESTNADLGRGGRRTVIVLDEFASVLNDEAVLSATQEATKCRIFNSTPKGSRNAFSRLRMNPGLKKIRLHWLDHPEKSAGKYQDARGRWRSPAYDEALRRAIHPTVIAQEWDIDYQASEVGFFDMSSLQRVEDEDVRVPLLSGQVVAGFSGRPVFEEQLRGPCRLWIPLLGGDCPEAGSRYVIGCDVGLGTGATESTASVFDVSTMEKVCEVGRRDRTPSEWASDMILLGRWFNDAKLIWEANGPGNLFTKALLEIGYRNIYYRVTSDKSAFRRASDKPGWYTTPESKLLLLGRYRQVLVDRAVVIHSQVSVDQARQYVFVDARRVEFSGAFQGGPDVSAAGENHGDMVIADALAILLLTERGRADKDTPERVPEGSFAWRRRQYEEKRKPIMSY